MKETNQVAMPNKRMDLFFTKNLNNSFVSSKSGAQSEKSNDEI